uniref:hybrid sensor histidine kinase/response regulator n=1 Tax=Treponema sp. TaxID=166 RepID=UPI00298DF850
DYELVKLMNDISNVVLVRLQNKDVELRLELEPDLPSVLHGDDMRLRQILINLAGNSAKFTERGHVCIRVENLLQYEQREGLRISVIDTGVGIRKEDLEKLFGAFQQVDMKMNRTKGGTGLGLSISKNLVQLMGGSIGVQSEYGKGSMFYFSVPQTVVDKIPCSKKYKPLFDKAASLNIKPDTTFPSDSILTVIPVVSLLNKPEFASLFAEKNTGITFTAPDAKILVVDDNEVNIQVAQGLLKKFGVIPDCVLSGFAALDKIAKKDYDIIFMDHQMPEMDGVETLKKIREQESQAQSDNAANSVHRIVVALSANAVNGAREMFLQNGFDDFVAKPVQGKDFGECLLRHLPKNLIVSEGVYALGPASADSLLPPDFPSWDSKKLDVERAVEMAGGLDNYLVVARTFYSSIIDIASGIEDFFKMNDIKNYTIQVHALKSSARIIGAQDLSKKAEYLEMLGKKLQQTQDKEARDKLTKYTPILLKLYRSYAEYLKPIVDFEKTHSSAETGEFLSDEELNDIMLRIAEAAKNCDLDTAEQEFAAVKNSAIPDELSEDIQNLASAIDNIDLDQIADLARKIIERK